MAFHVELRQFPGAARAFNLSDQELHRRILEPWVSGRTVELDERQFNPARARLTVYEGRSLEAQEIGLGRGWANVTRVGEDVTERVVSAAREAVAPSSLEPFKEAVMAALPATLDGVVEIAHARYPQLRASARLGLAEQAVWELLHQRRVELRRDGVDVGQAEWEPALLEWVSWTGASRFVLVARGQPSDQATGD